MTSRNRSAWAWIVGMLLTVVLYVLSIGPSFWLVLRNPGALKPYRAIYLPIRWARLESETTDNAITAYLSFFTARRPLTEKQMKNIRVRMRVDDDE